MGNTFLTRLQNVLDPRYRHRHGLNPNMERVTVLGRDLDEIIHQFIRLDNLARDAHNKRSGIKPDTLPVREAITELWNQLPDGSHAHAMILLDARSYHEVGHWLYEDSLLRTVQFAKVLPIDNEPWATPDVPNNPDERMHRVIAIRYTKSNGRTAYLDDPHNPSEYM